MAVTMGRYLTQASTFLAPASVHVADYTLRQMAEWLLANTTTVTVAGITRDDIEGLKLWLATRPGNAGKGLSSNTQRQRLRMLRMFFERIIEWDWADAPARNPIIGRDIHRAQNLSPSSSTTATRPSSWPRPEQQTIPATDS
jgi:hypothetical protein